MNWKFGAMKKFWTVCNDSQMKMKMPVCKMPIEKAMFTRKELGTFRKRVHKTEISCTLRSLVSQLG